MINRPLAFVIMAMSIMFGGIIGKEQPFIGLFVAVVGLAIYLIAVAVDEERNG